MSVSNLPSAQGKHQSSVVHTRTVITEPTIVERAKELQTAIDEQKLNTLAEQRSTTTNAADAPVTETSTSWKALLSLFKADSRDELITLLGFSKDEVASKVAEAVEKLKSQTKPGHINVETADSHSDQDLTEVELREPVVSFAEPEREATPEEEGGLAAETTPSEVSAGAASDTTSTTRLADGESTTTAPSLFGDEPVAGTPQTDAAADFFGSIGTVRDDEQMEVPHHQYPIDSSVAATIGSRPSSVASESLKANTFRIYPNDESETDRLVTKALVLGDFESAVSLCLSSDRFADAILLAVRGGPELLQSTQKAYFERQTTAHPYLRLFQSIVTNDLADIVQNADLQEWQEIFVVLCTFAGQEEFSGLAEQLGQRLEFQASVARTSNSLDAQEKAKDFSKNATLTYLAAGKLERLVNIWIHELAEEERGLLANKETLHGSRYTAHALALQTFIEKVTVFRSAIGYEDPDLNIITTNEEAEARTYKLSGLYDRYFEYADLLAAQGLVKEAVAFLRLTPSDYHGAHGTHLDFTEGRKRLLSAAGASALPARSASLPAAAPALPSKVPPVASTSNVYAYGQYGAPQQPAPIPQPTAAAASVYDSYAPTAHSQPAQHANPYAPPIAATHSAPQPYQSQPYQTGPYSNSYSQAPQQQQQHQPQHQQPLIPPPRGANGTPSAPPLGPPPKGTASIKRDNGGWNDAPTIPSQRRTPANLPLNKPAAITAPFPNAALSPGPGPGTPPFSGGRGQPPQNLPPPPRPGSVNRPPPQGPPQGIAPPHMRPPSGPPGPGGSQFMPPPPGRMMSPPQGGPGAPPPPRGPGEFGFPPRGGPIPGHSAPPPPGGPNQGPYARMTPSPNFARDAPPPGPPQSGPYAPPPQQGSFAPPMQQGPGPYAPPPGQQPNQFAPPPGQHAPRPGPPGQAGPPPPPPGSAARGPTPAAPPRKTGPPPPKYRKFPEFLEADFA